MSKEQVEQVIYGDALKELKECKLENKIDLIYIDPLFYTGRIWKNYNERLGIKVQYNDQVKTAEEWIKINLPILKEIKRLLSPTGTLYIHCDWHIDGWIRYYCEQKELFGEDGFIGNVYWQTRIGNNRGGRSFGNVLQSILMYSKTQDYKFHPRKTRKEEKTFPFTEPETGRKYALCNLIHRGDGIGPKTLNFIGRFYTIPDVRVFKWSQKNLDEKLRNNPNIIDWSSDQPRYKLYEDEYEGVNIPNLWNDIAPLKQTDTECQWPTQKPIQLLERIIDTSSDKNDIVLDCFCGSGTTLVAAKRMGRQFIGIDREVSAVCIAAKRLGILKTHIKNYPMTLKDVDEIEDPYDLQWWVCEFLNADCGNKGKDGGLDGRTHITDYPIQIKQHAQISLVDAQHYKTVWESDQKGIFVGTSISHNAQNEIDKWNNHGWDIHFYDYRQIIEGKPFEDKVCMRRTMDASIEQALKTRVKEALEERKKDTENIMNYLKVPIKGPN